MNEPFDVIHFDGVPRALACRTAYGICLLPEWADHYEAVSADRLEPCRLEYDLPILDQGASSACGGFAACEALALAHAMRTGGREVLRLSGTYLYSKVNGGVDQGSVLSSLLEAAKRFGCAPIEAFPEDRLFIGQGSPDADRLASRLRVEEALVLRSAQDLLTALWAHRTPVVMGIQVPTHFAEVDADGVSPPPGPGNPLRGGHALLADEIYVSVRYGLCVGGPNSWGPRFGQAGRYRVPVRGYLDRQVDAFAIKGLIGDPASDGPVARG